MAYNVAFRKTKVTGIFVGLVTWTTYSSKEEFDSMWKKENHPEEEIAGEGITNDKFIELVKQSYIDSSFAKFK